MSLCSLGPGILKMDSYYRSKWHDRHIDDIRIYEHDYERVSM